VVRSAVTPCSSGLVALTFDDGPSSALTPDFLRVLHDRGAPATFFVIGERVRANPGVVRRAGRMGFTIGNQTYHHENLVRLGDNQIETTLRRTRRAVKAAGARPSTLMRPPYGSIDARVRAVVRGVGLVPVMWTADPRDWEGRSASTIAKSTLSQLNPHQPNVVVLHDGVANSAQTLLALPRIIRGARDRGYCPAALDAQGRPRPPVPRARVSNASVRERPGGWVMTMAVTLDRPTSRRTSVRVRTVAGTASAGRDYVATDQRVTFPVGARKHLVRVRVRDDLRDERTERLAVRLSAPRGLRVKDGRGIGRILDDDPPPRVTVADARVTEPTEGTVDVTVALRLSRASGKRVGLTLSTQPGSADESDFVPLTERITFAPGQLRAVFTVTVRADEVDEGPESFEVVARDGTDVDLAAAGGVVTIVPPSG